MIKHAIQFWCLFFWVLGGLFLSAVPMVTAQETATTAKPALTDPVAIVNKTVIDYAALKRAKKVPFYGSVTPMNTLDDTLSKEQMALERLIHRRLLYEAAVAKKITVGVDKVDEAFTLFLRRLPGPHAYKSLLSKLKMTEADVKNEITKDLAIEALTEEVTGDTTIAPEKIKEYYDANPHLFAETAKIRFREIYLPKTEPPDIDPKLEKTIAQIQTALDQEVDFIRLADRYTPKDQIKNGGDRGYIWAGSLDPDLEDRLFAMEIDTISDPIETEMAVLFIKIVDKQLEQLAPFPVVKKEIENYLLAKKHHTKMVQYIDQLKTNAHIERLLPDEAESETVVE